MKGGKSSATRCNNYKNLLEQLKCMKSEIVKEKKEIQILINQKYLENGE